MTTSKEKWQSMAYFASKKAIKRHCGPFLAEKILAEVVKNIGEPLDRRSYGGVIQSLHKDGFIERIGYGSAVTSNRAPKVLWIRA